MSVYEETSKKQKKVFVRKWAPIVMVAYMTLWATEVIGGWIWFISTDIGWWTFFPVLLIVHGSFMLGKGCAQWKSTMARIKK